MKIHDVLGLNSRNHLYTSLYNTSLGKKTANSKLETKRVLKAAGVRVPQSYAVIRSHEDLDKFDFLSLPPDFVVKPNNGLGGQGIMVVERRGVYAGEWITAEGHTVGIEDLRLHIGDILAGQYSMDDIADIAYIEERVRVHPVFAKYSYHGTPDIRVIVFNKVPVMSYVRLPTEESGGRANLFQGAAAVGIDMATGITTYGVHHARPVEFFPGTRRKLGGILIPQWDEILETAINASEASGLGYMAADIVLQPSTDETGKMDKDKPATPMILEINAQPGLKIQIANRAGLRDRLQRIRGLKIQDAKHGIRVSKALFPDTKLLEKGLGRKTIGAFEEVEVTGLNGIKERLIAKVDTGADYSSIHAEIAQRLGLLEPDNILGRHKIQNSVGSRRRDMVGITYVLSGRKMKTRATVADRSKLKYKMLIGKNDLGNFAVIVGEKNS